MKRLLFLFLISFLSQCLFAQSEEVEPPPGTVSAKIYTHFNYSLDSENPSTTFEVKRAYFAVKRTSPELHDFVISNPGATAQAAFVCEVCTG